MIDAILRPIVDAMFAQLSTILVIAIGVPVAFALAVYNGKRGY